MASNELAQWLRQNIRLTAVITVAFLAVLLGMIAILGQSSAKPFNGFTSVKCDFSGNVIVFLDANGGGVHQPDSVGVPGVSLTIKHTVPLYLDNGTPQTRVSDSSGHVSFYSDRNCSLGDSITVNIALPNGYTATTPLTFGPYDVPNLATDQPGTLWPSIPQVIYVGLRQG